jgi:hypothetical protein
MDALEFSAAVLNILEQKPNAEIIAIQPNGYRYEIENVRYNPDENQIEITIEDGSE